MALLPDLRTEKPSDDPTQTNVTLAILDQTVAGAQRGKRYCYVAVMEGSRWTLGLAVHDERGYSQLRWPGQYMEFESAKRLALGMNLHIGASPSEAADIVASTLRSGRRGR